MMRRRPIIGQFDPNGRPIVWLQFALAAGCTKFDALEGIIRGGGGGLRVRPAGSFEEAGGNCSVTNQERPEQRRLQGSCSSAPSTFRPLMSAEDRKSCSASLNSCFRFNFSWIPDDQLQGICPLSAVSHRRGGAEATSGRRGGEGGRCRKCVQQATTFCFLRPATLSVRSQPTEGTILRRRLSDLLPFLGPVSQRQEEVFTFATD